MPVTLAQAQKLTQNKLAAQIINEFRKDGLFEMMLFDDCVALNGGSTLSYVYNRVKTLPTADFRAINSEYVAQESDTDQFTVNLKVFGGSFKIDRVVQNDVRGITNQVSFQLQQKIDATKALFGDAFINGDSGTNANAFDGIDKAVTGSSTEKNTVNPIDLSTSASITANANAFMDALDDMLADMNGTPDALYMNRKLLAIMNGIARRSGYFSTSDVDAFGRPVTKYAGIPLQALGDKPGTSNPIIGIDPTAKTTSIYGVRFALDNVHAVTPQGSDIINTYLPDFKQPGAVKTGEVEMVAAIAVKATRGIAALRKIKVG